MTQLRRLNSPGPVAARFMQSRAFLCGIVGPVGSAKTLSAAQKCLLVGAKQGGRRDEHGILRRRARVGVIRESYPNIEANILKSWFNIVPEEEGKFNWRAPYTHKFAKVLRRDADNRPVDILDMEMEFRAIGDKSVEEVTRGWEINAAWIDEFDLQPPELISFLSGRVGRFSDLDPGLVVDPQIILSLNMPYMDNHAYRLLLEEELGALDPKKNPDLAEALQGRPLMECFVQPGGLDPDAENIHNLPGGRGYYHLQVAANKHRPGYVDRMIHNKPVPMQYGQPVNPGFSYSEHVQDLVFDPRRKLIVAMDQGLFAAAVAGQRTAMGQLRTLRECVFMREDGKALEKIGPTAFGQAVRAMLNESFGDAAGAQVELAAPRPLSRATLPPRFAHLEKYVAYLVNVGSAALPLRAFDDDWAPIGPDIRRELVKEGFALEFGGKIALVSMMRQVVEEANHRRIDLTPNALRFVADPAAFSAGDRADNEFDWILAVQKAIGGGVRIHRAKTNSPQLRNGVIWTAMSERGGYAVDRSCKHLIRGHLGGYHYRKAELAAVTGTEARGHLQIADTIYTHVCDAEQYGALEGEHVIGDLRGKPRREGRIIRNESDYAVLGR